MFQSEMDKVAHLCRRVGFGLSLEDRERYSGMKLDAVKNELLDFKKTATFPIHPLEGMWNERGEFQNQVQRLGGWWCLRMAFGDLPVRDKLLLFMHDHFAVSGEKVASPLLMMEYLQMLDDNLDSPFAKVLEEVTANPGMMVWLDLATNVKGRPNENFSREVLELFTLGVDNGYTEADIRELSRVFTGWSVRSSIDGRTPAERQQQVVTNVKLGIPLAAGSYSAGLHDTGPYKIFGKTQDYDTKSICEMLAKDPRTAKHLATKMWEFYVYPDPEKAVIERISNVFLKSGGRLGVVLRAIVDSKEFWSEKAYRAVVKCPLDYVVPMIRQLVSKEQALAARSQSAEVNTPLPNSIVNLGLTIQSLSSRMGMLPLFPPDVAGWNWGTGWISTSVMIDRVRLADVFTNQNQGRSAAVKLTELVKAKGLKTEAELVGALADIFDLKLTPESNKVLETAVVKSRLPLVLNDLNRTSAALRPILRTLFSVPEFQMM